MKNKKLTKVQHKKRHIKLHKCLDELMADYIDETGKLPSNTTVMELMNWSFLQTKRFNNQR